MKNLALSQTAGYAIQALSLLSEDREDMILAKEIADKTGIPRAYLSKILHALTRSGLIVSKRGYKGGVALARRRKEISLLDIIDAIEGEDRQCKCLLGLVECSDERACPVHEFWKHERERIELELRRYTLAELAAFETAWLKRPEVQQSLPTADPPSEHHDEATTVATSYSSTSDF